MTQAEAETKLAEQELVALPASEQPDENVPVGSVDLVVGARRRRADRRRRGAAGTRGPARRVHRPGAADRSRRSSALTVEQATAALQAIQLGVTVAEPVFSDDIPAGSVVSANPPDGTGGIPRGTAVTITPSKGVDLVTAPDLTGQTLQQAQRRRSPPPACSSARVLGNTQGIVVEATVPAS